MDTPTKSAFTASFRRWVRQCINIHLEPHQFFTRIMPEIGNHASVQTALGWALACHWVGAVGEYLWRTLFHQTPAHLMSKMFEAMERWNSPGVDASSRDEFLNSLKDPFIQWFSGAGWVVLDPFVTLVSILVTAFFVSIGAKLLTDNSRPISQYSTAVLLVAYGRVPSLLAAIPFVGSWVAAVASLLITIAGAKVFYRVSSTRAALITLFPQILFALAVVIPILALISLVFGGLLSLFALTPHA